jgi:DNA topoisomerase I
MDVVIVESPNKVKKLSELLGTGYQVTATSGHFRDLPHKVMGVDIEGHTFALTYEFTPPSPIPNQPGKFFPGGKDRLDRVKMMAKNANNIYIATDLDREGEAIAWHVRETLQPKHYRRIVFNEITESALKSALKNYRLIDDKMVEAQEGRRAADRLVGYLVSPVLSELLGFPASAGRVQSVALRLVVDREREILKFKPISHYGAIAWFDNKKWSAEWDTTEHLTGDSPYIFDTALAQLAATCKNFEVIHSEKKPRKESPPAPFSTSTLLQAASIQLNFSSDKTSKLAQKLFEQGVITYIRTDTNNLAEEANLEIRAFAQQNGYAIAEKIRKFPSKDGAQEAHEAIRPTHIDSVSEGTTDDEKTLYRLIWERAVASQLADAVYSVNHLVLKATAGGKTFRFKATGKTLVSEGWRKLTKDDSTNEDTEEDSNGKVPEHPVGADINSEKSEVLNKKTKAPSRYTEASLVKKLEAEQIGRPATYSTIITTLTRRGYVEEKAKRFIPSEVGCKIVDALVESQFEFIELGFTQSLEEKLDQIYTSEATYIDVISTLHDSVVRDLERLTAQGRLMPTHDCPECKAPLKRVKSKTGKFFWGCSRWQEGCKCLMDDVGGKPIKRKIHNCPECQSPLALNKTYWFCTNKELKCPTIPNYRAEPMAASLYRCPQAGCGKPMRRIKGSNGFFWGCSGYKEGCKATLPDKAGLPDRGVTESKPKRATSTKLKRK